MNIVNEYENPMDIETWFIKGFGYPIVGWMDYGMCDIGIEDRLFGIVPKRKRIGGVVKRFHSICTIADIEYVKEIKAKIRDYEKYSGNSITVYIKHNGMRTNLEKDKKIKERGKKMKEKDKKIQWWKVAIGSIIVVNITGIYDLSWWWILPFALYGVLPYLGIGAGLWFILKKVLKKENDNEQEN